jgi:hypothetical protein
MTSQRRSASGSVRTGKSVKSSSPFKKGSVREKAFHFLQKDRTLPELRTFIRKLGASPQDLLRYLRKYELIMEFQEKVTWKYHA